MNVKTRIAAAAVALGAAGIATRVAVASDAGAAKEGMPGHQIVPADRIQWADVPPALPKGAKIAVLQGDPSAAGNLVTVRLKMPAGYTIPPHFHPTDEAVTVISGALRMGMGDRIDRRTATTLKPGGWAVMPKDEHHYAVAAAPTIVQVHMTGPFAITYVNPADDPRTSAEK